jgi:hypothetical protein
MTREEIEKRMSELVAAKEKLVADLNAVSGAIQDCEYWLAKLAEKEQAEHDAQVQRQG